MNNQLPIKTGTWSLIRYRPWHFALSTVMALYAFGMRLVPGWLEKSYFEQVQGQAGTAVALSNSLWTLLLLIIGVELSRMVTDILGNWAAAIVRQAGQSVMRINLLKNILSKPGAEPLPVPTGDVINRMDDDLAETPAEVLALSLAGQMILAWSDRAFSDRAGSGRAMLARAEGAIILHPEIGDVIRAAYDRTMPEAASDPSHALRLAARVAVLTQPEGEC